MKKILQPLEAAGVSGLSVTSGDGLTCQYLSLPHIFLLDSETPVGFLLDSRTPVGFLLDFNNFSKKGILTYFFSYGLLLDSYWIPTGLQLDLNKIPESEYIVGY